MKSIRWIKKDLKVNFLNIKNIATIISIVALISSIFFILFKNLNFGIDFKGGTLIEIKKEHDLTISNIRSQLSDLGLGDIQIQTFGSADVVLIRIENSSDLISNADMNSINIIKTNLGSKIEIQRTEIVGPKVSSELVQKGLIAIIVAVILMLFYIWIRFEWQFSIGAIIALIHDIIITIGIFSFFQIEFNLSIIAALLTIIGYSMNDTVVVYDRIRENLRKYKSLEIYQLINQSLNETMSRTVLTSFTTLLALFSLYFLGGEVLKGFTLAMIIGVFIGTYSSIFIASQIILYLNVKRDWSKN
tara:strand:- start:1292 stop:2200 length:909 start_codon:yes stop_codon:yes gene_type:complete